jgi:hypothetical protein
MLCALSLVIAILALHYASVGDEIATDQSSPQEPLGEIGPVGSSVGFIEPFKGAVLSIYPKLPSGSVKERGGFYYEQIPTLDIPNDFYDAKTRLLNFSIVFVQPTDTLLQEARKSVALTLGEPSQFQDVSLLPLEIVGCNVYVSYGDKRQRISLDVPDSSTSISGRISCGVKIQVPEIHHALEQRSSSVRIVIEPKSRFRVYTVESALGSIQTMIVDDIKENVFPNSRSSSILVNRNILNEIQSNVEQTVRWRLIRNGAKKSEVDLAIKGIVNKFLAIDKLELKELRDEAILRERLVYSLSTAIKDVSPEILHIVALDESGEDVFKHEVENQWAWLHNIYEKGDSYLTYFNKLHRDQSTHGKANMGYMNVWGGGHDVDFASEWDDLSSGAQGEFMEFFEELKANAKVSEKTYNKRVYHFTGRKELTKVTPQDIELYRISKGDLEIMLRVIYDVVTELGSITRGPRFELPLEGEHTNVTFRGMGAQISEMSTEIDRLNANVERLTKSLNAINAQSQGLAEWKTRHFGESKDKDTLIVKTLLQPEKHLRQSSDGSLRIRDDNADGELVIRNSGRIGIYHSSFRPDHLTIFSSKVLTRGPEGDEK